MEVRGLLILIHLFCSTHRLAKTQQAKYNIEWLPGFFGSNIADCQVWWKFDKFNSIFKAHFSPWCLGINANIKNKLGIKFNFVGGYIKKQAKSLHEEKVKDSPILLYMHKTHKKYE